jgi:hypothetical protein
MRNRTLTIHIAMAQVDDRWINVRFISLVYLSD